MMSLNKFEVLNNKITGYLSENVSLKEKVEAYKDEIEKLKKKVAAQDVKLKKLADENKSLNLTISSIKENKEKKA